MNNTEKPWKAGRGLNRFNSNSTNNDKDRYSDDLTSQNSSYYDANLTKILFLSKRGMSRSPLAREMMQKLIADSHLFGRVRISSRGATEAYDQCPIDARMSKFSSDMGYFLQGFSRFATIPDLASADIIITMDLSSEDFTQLYKHYIKGFVRPIGQYFTPGSNPYVEDPFERKDDEDVDDHYDEIVSSIQYGCSKLFAHLPALID